MGDQKRRMLIYLTLLVVGLLIAITPAHASQHPRHMQASDTAELYAEKSLVQWQPAGAESFQEMALSQRQMVHTGDLVVTDGLGQAQLRFAGGFSATIYHDSQLQIEAINIPTGTLGRVEGTLLLVPEGQGAEATVETPNARIEGTGQVFVHYQPRDEATWVIVKQGQAVVEASGAAVTVASGQQTWVDGTGSPVAAQPAERDVVGTRFYLLDDLTNGAILDADWLAPTPLPPPPVPWAAIIAIVLLLAAVVAGVLILARRRRPAPRPAAAPAGVRMVLADGSDRFVPMRGNLLTIGRARENNLTLLDTQASQHHARIIHQPDGYIIEDLDSTNGTFVSGHKVAGHLLRDGDEIRIGQTRLVFQIPEVTPVPPERAPRRPAPAPAGLWVMGAGGPGEFVPVRGNLLTIGRARESNLVLRDGQVSHHHARIIRQPEGYVLEDLDSTNGTFVGGQRVTRQLLQDDDEIRIGQTRLSFQIPETALAPPARAPRRPPPARAGVRVIQADGSGQFVPMPGNLLTIGRARENNLTLLDRQASQRHARIIRQPEGYVLEDLDSTNGTFVNGRRVTRQLLRDGDEIRIGQTRLTFEGHSGEEVGS